MTRQLGLAAFFTGLIAVAWVGAGYATSNPLALLMTALIAAFYLMGALELRRFHQATGSLAQALAALPDALPALGDWLSQVHPSLQNPVRMRIEGERVALPGPAMTPYLVGLLVLLGMLGTFLGMVVTLNGAVMALESTTDLPTIRAALSAPVKGLGLAFGTSVAGVSASAMLGLLSALCRRDRLQAAQRLDTRIATTLRGFSLAHQRQATLETLQHQARLMPEVAAQWQAMMAQMAQQHQALNAQLSASQDSFHRQTATVYSDLAASVGQSLKQSLADGARLAGATLQPVAEATMAGIARESSLLHDKLARLVEQQLAGVSTRLGSAVATVSDTWRDALARQQRGSEALSADLQQSQQALARHFEQQSASLLATVGQAHSGLQADLAAQDQQRLATWRQALDDMAAALQRQWQQAGEHSLGQQEKICQTLAQTAGQINAQAQAHASQTLAEVAALMQTAAQAPQAAAEVMGALRAQLSDSLVRDNALLEERSRIMATLGTLLEAVNQAATQQRGAVDALVASSAALLTQVSTRFEASVEAQSTKIAAAAVQITGSAVEVSSLGEAFGQAVSQFGDSNDALIASLQRIEAALGKSTARSDEQLAYYVAQAREIIDLSILSQKQIVEDLQQLALRQVPLDGQAA